MPCDAACKKIIINTLFMSIFAEELANVNDGLADSATRLKRAATAHAKALAALGFRVESDDLGDFKGNGCEQAKTLVKWIKGEGVGDDAISEDGQIAQLEAWTADEWEAIRELVEGTMS